MTFLDFSFYQGMYRMYKFKSTGWRNVCVSGFMSAMVVGLVITVIGIAGRNEQLWFERSLRKLKETRAF
jgi:hypothetical protein